MLVEKRKDKRRKLYHFSDLINDFSFYDMRRTEFGGMKGTLYYLCDNVSVPKRKYIDDKYHNTLWVVSICEYAPEIKKCCLFIAE